MASEIYHNNTLPLLLPSCQPVPTTVASDYCTVEGSSRCLEEGSVYTVHGRGRAPNWTDAETRFLLDLWRDRFPLNKRRNSSAWVAIAKQLNKLLAKHCLSNFRSGPQCKARIKYLGDEYKRVYKARKERNGNDREATFDYFDEMDAVLGSLQPNNSSSAVQISGFNDEQPPLISASPIRSTAPEVESTPNNVAHTSGSNENPLFFSPIKAEFMEHVEPDISDEEDDDVNDAVAVAEPRVPRENTMTTTDVTRGESSFTSSDLMKFLEESRKRDHEFFRMLVEKEGERELQRQKMMFDMMKEVARIFKGDKSLDTN